MEKICSQCGAKLKNKNSCNELFEDLLSKEFDNPDYGKVHHLSVPCYNLQHNLYAKEAWFAVRNMLREFVEENKSPERARYEINKYFNGNKKEFSMVHGEKIDNLDKIEWSFTVENVRLEEPNEYCQDIYTWASAVLKDTDHLV